MLPGLQTSALWSQLCSRRRLNYLHEKAVVVKQRLADPGRDKDIVRRASIRTLWSPCLGSVHVGVRPARCCNLSLDLFVLVW